MKYHLINVLHGKSYNNILHYYGIEKVYHKIQIILYKNLNIIKKNLSKFPWDFDYVSSNPNNSLQEFGFCRTIF